MSQDMLPVFLRAVDDRAAIGGGRGTADPVLGIIKHMAPLGLTQIARVEILALCFAMRALAAEEMHMGVTTEPALGVHIRPALETQRQSLLAGCDVDVFAHRHIL